MLLIHGSKHYRYAKKIAWRTMIKTLHFKTLRLKDPSRHASALDIAEKTKKKQKCYSGMVFSQWLGKKNAVYIIATVCLHNV